jgi:hypothetical protein
MIRKRFVATVLAMGTSAATVIAADSPGAVNLPAQPPERIIKVQIGFDPNPLEEPSVAAPEPLHPIVPTRASAVIPPPPPAPLPPPVHAAPPPMAMAAPEAAKPRTLTLAALERMAIEHMTMSADPQSVTGSAVQPCSAGEIKLVPEAPAVLPYAFIDQVAAAAGKSNTSPQMLTQEYRVLNNVRLRYYHALALQRLIAVHRELAGISYDAVHTIDTMAAAGLATKAELLQARAEARERFATLHNIKEVHQAVWQRLAVSVGQPELPMATLDGDLEKCCATISYEGALRHILLCSPEIMAARGEVAMRQAAVRSNQAGSCQSCRDKTSSDGIVSQAVASLVNGPFATREQTVKPATWSELSRSEQEVGRVEQSLRHRLANAYRSYERAKELSETYRSQNLPDTKEAFEQAVIAYRQGHGSWPQVQIAQKNYFRMSTEYVESLADLRRSELAILGLVMDVPEDPRAMSK